MRVGIWSGLCSVYFLSWIITFKVQFRSSYTNVQYLLSSINKNQSSDLIQIPYVADHFQANYVQFSSARPLFAATIKTDKVVAGFLGDVTHTDES